jgi:ABC-2 type transport system ATP-binding protein
MHGNAEALAALVEQSPLGIYTVDSEFRVRNVSAGAMPAFRNVEPLIGRDFAEVMRILWPESFASEAIRIFRHTLATGEPYVSPGLTEKRNASFMSLSGGQKQRLFIALALINDPEVVFLDELTTGLDPQARRAIWDLVNGIRARGKTVFLTTHYMEEAERLCDRVAIIEHGRLIELGAPAELVRKHCPERGVVFSSDREGLAGDLERVAGAGSVRVEGDTYTVQGRGDDFVTAVIRFIAAHALTVRDFRTVFPTLEDVFLKLTGHVIRD